MAAWYAGSVQWTAVTAWAALTAYSVGDLRRQLATPTVGNERVWRCTTAGTSLASEPSWTLTKGSTTTEVAGPVWTEVTGNSTYGWTAAHARLENAISWGVAGATYYVANDHTQTQASAFTLTFKGTAASPDRALCVNPAGSVPPVAGDLSTGASLETTGASNITISGRAYIYGLTIKGGSGANASIITLSSGGVVIWDACAIEVRGTSPDGYVRIVSSTTIMADLRNTTISFSAVGQSIDTQFGALSWVNKPGSAALLGTAPTTLITGGGGALVYFEGLDLSAMGSGQTIFGANSAVAKFQTVNCKLDSAVTVCATPAAPKTQIDLIGSHSTTNVARNERYGYQGTLTTETTIVRTGGASDGTTPYSWKIVSNANNERDFPFETFEGAVWNTTTGSSKTLTVHCVTDNVTLTDAEIWIEVHYLGSSATPVCSTVTDANATVLTTPANQATSTEAWTTTGLGTPVYQKLECTFTPQMAGPIRWSVRYAKTSSTVYVCPDAELS